MSLLKGNISRVCSSFSFRFRTQSIRCALPQRTIYNLVTSNTYSLDRIAHPVNSLCPEPAVRKPGVPRLNMAFGSTVSNSLAAWSCHHDGSNFWFRETANVSFMSDLYFAFFDLFALNVSL